jgi:hypothetical protein
MGKSITLQESCLFELTTCFLIRLVVASEYEPFSIVEKLSPYLGGSASVVVYSLHLQVRVLIQSIDMY